MKTSAVIFVGSIILISLLAILLPVSNAQSKFQLTVGGTGNDYVYSIIQTMDGGYALAGTATGAWEFDFYIVKIDSGGNLQWSRTIGGTGSDYGHCIIQTRDGGYAVAGSTWSFGAGLTDMYIVKLDGSGALQWSKAIGGTTGDAANSIIQTLDGGYAVAGLSVSQGGAQDFCILKLDPGGNLQWNRTIGGTAWDEANSIVQTIDGDYAVAGRTISFGAGDFDFYIVKLNASGTLQWNRTVGGTSSDEAYSLIQTPDGGYALAGFTNSFGAGIRDFYIVTLNASGTLQWNRTVGGPDYDEAYSIIQTTDGGYAVAGFTLSFGAGNPDVFAVKLNAGGTLQWCRTLGGTNYDYAYSIIQTTDSGYAVGGYTNSFGAGGSDAYILKLDASGSTCGNTTSPLLFSINVGGSLGNPTPTVMSPALSVSSVSSSAGTNGSVTTICTVVGAEPISNNIPERFSLHQNYPNPFNPKSKIKYDIANSGNAKLIIYDARGREIITLVNEQLQPGTYEVEWDATNYPSGVYFYKLEAGDFKETKKMILVK